jgi:hypothetical protein
MARLIRKITDGSVYIWAEHLAARPDFEEVREVETAPARVQMDDAPKKRGRKKAEAMQEPEPDPVPPELADLFSGLDNPPEQ